MKNKKGRYSGNVRLDPKEEGFEEPDMDNEYTLDMWLGSGDIQNDPDFHEETRYQVELWKKAISLTADPDSIIVHTAGESHIDCAWLWRYEQTREKAYKTFRKACKHGDLFPEKFNFALSEPLLLEWVKEDHPDTFKEIQEKVKAGNIELVGGSYVEPDCMMPSGEAFARMRLYGMRFLRENFGILPEVEWFLDSFGYNWGIPQILVKSGAKYFWTSKITWNLDTVFPFVNFWWQGPDGSRILTANFQMGTGPLTNWGKFEIGRHPLKKNGKKVWNYIDEYEDICDHVEEDEICPHVGNFFGKGDGGHGPTHQEVAVTNEYCKTDMFKWGKVHDFYRELEKWSDRFPIWADELYLENHRGTFSVHAEVKRHNRKNENALTSHETLALITKIINPDFKYPFDTFEWGWKTTLKNQFHDVLPGSSIPEVYDDAWDDWCEQEESYQEVIGNVATSLEEKVFSETNNKTEPESKVIYLYNPANWERKNRVFIPIDTFTENIHLNQDGKPNYAKLIAIDGKKEFICQPIAAEPEKYIENMNAGWYVIPELASVGITPFKFVILNDSESQKISSEGTLKAQNMSISKTSMTNGNVNLKIDINTGAITQLTLDDINQGKNLLKGDQSNLTFVWEDRPKNWPAWNLEHYWNYPIDIDHKKNVSVRIAEQGPVFVTLEVTKTIIESEVKQRISLFKDCPEIFLEYLTDWKTSKRLLKVLYSTSTNAETSVADIAYSAIKRKTEPETRCDKARFEKIMHKYVDLSTPDNSWGIALLNEGKYAFDTEVDNESLRLTMLRSPDYPGAAGEAWVLKERKVNKEKYGHKIPQYSGLGPFKCRYALLPHLGGALTIQKGDGNNSPNEVVKRRAEEFNQPVIVIPLSKSAVNPKNISLLSIPTQNIFLGTFKLNEWEKNGNIIARFVEGCGISSEVIVQINPEFARKVENVKAVDILEREIEFPFDWNKGKGILKYSTQPFEINTFAFEYMQKIDT
ncbi:MAG: hypothetical protein GF364_10765 [Candidatus Lokiarchaeota archaeon]|nr:hypothetical protein [Candidatus Lokiarchaeota archaeon]